MKACPTQPQGLSWEVYKRCIPLEACAPESYPSLPAAPPPLGPELLLLGLCQHSPFFLVRGLSLSPALDLTPAMWRDSSSPESILMGFLNHSSRKDLRLSHVQLWGPEVMLTAAELMEAHSPLHPTTEGHLWHLHWICPFCTCCCSPSTLIKEPGRAQISSG